jgi:hypothetical protein
LKESVRNFLTKNPEMVLELTVDSVRRANTATAVKTATAWPSTLRALYLYRVRELTQGLIGSISIATAGAVVLLFLTLDRVPGQGRGGESRSTLGGLP